MPLDVQHLSGFDLSASLASLARQQTEDIALHAATIDTTVGRETLLSISGHRIITVKHHRFQELRIWHKQLVVEHPVALAFI